MFGRRARYGPAFSGFSVVGILVLVLIVWFALHVGPVALLLLLLLLLLFA